MQCKHHVKFENQNTNEWLQEVIIRLEECASKVGGMEMLHKTLIFTEMQLVPSKYHRLQEHYVLWALYVIS